jgi:glycosyltransferase involved in cell wall biosynthesis
MPPPRIVAISEIPTPYRLPLYEAVAARTEIDLHVVFCAAEQPDRPWELGEALERIPHTTLDGWSPAIRGRNETFVYEINPQIVPVLRRLRPDVLVIGGYAVFAEQLAYAYAALTRTPYVIHSETHALRPRRLHIRAAKRLLLRPLISHAAAGLAAGTAAAHYLESYGLDANRIRIFPNTVDVRRYREAAEAARRAAPEVLLRLGVPERYVLFAGRLIDVKGVKDLAEALRRLGDDAPVTVVAGEGPGAEDLRGLPSVQLVGFRQQDELLELMSLAHAVVIPSRADAWGVAVNEALAVGTPVIVSSAVGAALDLVRDGVDGASFAAGDIDALAGLLRAPPQRQPNGVSRIDRWDYALGVDQFIDAMRLALPGRISRT